MSMGTCVKEGHPGLVFNEDVLFWTVWCLAVFRASAPLKIDFGSGKGFGCGQRGKTEV